MNHQTAHFYLYGQFFCIDSFEDASSNRSRGDTFYTCFLNRFELFMIDVLPNLKHWDSKTLLLQQGLWDQQ